MAITIIFAAFLFVYWFIWPDMKEHYKASKELVDNLNKLAQMDVASKFVGRGK